MSQGQRQQRSVFSFPPPQFTEPAGGSGPSSRGPELEAEGRPLEPQQQQQQHQMEGEGEEMAVTTPIKTEESAESDNPPKEPPPVAAPEGEPEERARKRQRPAGTTPEERRGFDALAENLRLLEEVNRGLAAQIQQQQQQQRPPPPSPPMVNPFAFPQMPGSPVVSPRALVTRPAAPLVPSLSAPPAAPPPPPRTLQMINPRVVEGIEDLDAVAQATQHTYVLTLAF
jgi:hypothetical protein